MLHPFARLARPMGMLALLVLGSASFAACRTPTSITLEITTDVKCSDLKGISIASGSPDGAEEAPPATTTTHCTVVDESYNRIGSLVVVPSGDVGAEIAIRVVAGIDRPVDECNSARGYEGCVVARRRLRFEPHTELALPIQLHLDCKSVACNATSTCLHSGCVSSTIPGGCTGENCLDPDAGVDTGAPDGGDDAPPDTTPETSGCGSGQKSCEGKCVSITDPAFGCGATTCSPCDPSTHASYTCSSSACVKSGCAAGYKDCGGACEPADVDHGCAAASCSACPALNGVPSCEAGACKLTCSTGYKLCGGKCVALGDPTYGCGATTCDATSCPVTGGTVICSGGACVLGSCGTGTKACAGKCVPTDTNNGCGDASRCTPCASNETCVGGPPTTCQCVPETKAVTCAKVQCGTTKNNCGQTVDCSTTACVAPKTCGGAGEPNTCGCTPTGSPCDGVKCGSVADSCGTAVTCGCTTPKTCGGGGTAGVCGCTPIDPCAGGKCGTFDNGCGTAVTCSCTSPNSCGGGGTAGQCGCKPKSASVACGTKQCGTAPNGCGGNVSCGFCTGTNVCKCSGLCVQSTFICR